MKKFILITGLFAAFTAMASTSPIPQNRLSDYKAAAKIAITKSTVSCSIVTGFSDGFTIETQVEAATSAAEEVNGAQPLLSFITDDANDPKIRTIVSLSTSADYQSITSIKIERFKLTTETVNTGDLRNPSISQVTHYVSTDLGICN